MLLIAAMAQTLLLIEVLALAAIVTARTRSIAKGTLCLYGLGLLWVVLFSVLVPRLLPAMIEVDEREMADIFPTQIGILPVIVLLWIPSFVFAALVNLIALLAAEFSARPQRSASFGWLRRSICCLSMALISCLRSGLRPVDDWPYPKGVGALLGFVLPGSVHFLSGRRGAALLWYAAFAFCVFLVTVLLAIPGCWGLVGAAVAIALVLLVQGAVMVRSYRPVRRIGLHGWLVVLATAACLNVATQSVTRLVVHPFRFSGASMQPTIYGVHTEELAVDNAVKSRFFAGLFGGRRYVRWRAATSGRFEGPVFDPGASPLRRYTVGSDSRWLPESTRFRVVPGSQVSAGDLLFSGFVVTGDHVTVEKLTYRWRTPRRGEIIVFRTDGIPTVGAGEIWTMRIAGLPGERVRIDPPHLLIDGHRVTEPPILARIAAREGGYDGFQLSEDAQQQASEMEVVLGEDEYFVLGDNTSDAYDSRYWGPVPRENVIGRVTRIYWPFDRVNALEGKR